MKKTHTPLYSSNENLWLPFYLPINGFVVILGFGKIYLSTIVEGSVFVGKGIEDGPSSATSAEDIRRLKESDKRPLKAVDVFGKKMIDKNLVLIEAVKNINPIVEKIIYPFISRFPAMERYITDFHLNNIFNKVNENYQHLKGADYEYDKLVFAWDTRCIAYGGPRYNGIGRASMDLMSDFLMFNPLLKSIGFLKCLKKSTKKPDHWDDNVWKNYTLIAGANQDMAGITSDGQYTVLDENPPKVPSFIRAPHSTTFAEWSTSSCWYKTWCEVYNQSDNTRKVRKSSRFSNVASGKDDQDVEVVNKKRKIEQDTVFRHENAMEEKQNEEEDNVNKVVIEDQQHENLEDVNKVNSVDEIRDVITKNVEEKDDVNHNQENILSSQKNVDEPNNHVKDCCDENNGRSSDRVNEISSEMADVNNVNDSSDSIKNQKNDVEDKRNQLVSHLDKIRASIKKTKSTLRKNRMSEGTEKIIMLQTKQAASDILLAENSVDIKHPPSRSVPVKIKLRHSGALSDDEELDNTSSAAQVGISTVEDDLDIAPPVPESGSAVCNKKNDSVKVVHDGSQDDLTQSKLLDKLNKSSMKNLTKTLNDGLRLLSKRKNDNVDENLSDEDSVFQNLEDLEDNSDAFMEKDIWKTSLLKQLKSRKPGGEVSIVNIMETDYQEYLIEVDLDDIESPCDSVNVKEDYLKETAIQLKYGYQPTKGLITVNARKEDINIDLVEGKFHTLEKSVDKKEFMKIVDGVYRIVILKVQKEHGIIQSNKITVCLVLKNDGNLLSEEELTTYAARKQVLSSTSRKLTVSSMLRLCRKVCQFLHKRMTNSSSRSVHWYEQQVNMVIKLDDQNMSYTRNYIKVARACLEDKLKADVIDNLLCKYPVIGISHVSQKEVLRESDYVIELFIRSVAKAHEPSLKRYYNNQSDMRYKSKRKDKRNKYRRVPSLKEYMNKLILDIKKILMFILTLSKIYNYDDGLKLCRKTWSPVRGNKQDLYTIMELISDYTCEWIFEKKSHDLSDLATIINNTVLEKVLSSVPEDSEDKFCEVLSDLIEEEIENQTKSNSAKKSKRKSKKRIMSPAEIESADEAEEQGNQGGKKGTSDLTRSQQNSGKDNVSGKDNDLEDAVGNNKSIDNADDEKINDSVTKKGSKEQESDSVKDGESVGNNENDYVEDTAGNIKSGISDSQSVANSPGNNDVQLDTSKDAVEEKIIKTTSDEGDCSNDKIGPDMEKETTDNVKQIGADTQEKEKTKTNEDDTLLKLVNDSDKHTLIANNVSSEQVSYFVSLIGSPQRDIVTEDKPTTEHGRRNKNVKGTVKAIKIIPDSEFEPEMDKNKVPDSNHLDFLADEDRKKMDDSVKTVFMKEASKLIHPQSVWQRSNMRSMTLRLWLRHMFIPSGHRSNGLCTFELIKHIHAQLFSLAADRYFEEMTLTTEGAIKKPSISAVDRSIKDTFGKVYFEKKRKILADMGWVMFKGFAKSRTIHTSSGSFKNIISFSKLESFASNMPTTDSVSGQCLWNVVKDSENIDIVDVRKNPLEGRQITSDYAMTTYLEREGDIWKEKAILEMATGLLLHILNPLTVNASGVPKMYMPNTGGRVLRTLKNAKRQPFHCDLEVQNRGKILSCPGYTVMVSGSSGFYIWLAENSHSYLQHPDPKRSLKCRKLWVFPDTILFMRGDYSHAGAGFKESRASKNGDLRFHMVFVPISQKIPEDIFLTEFEKDFQK